MQAITVEGTKELGKKLKDVEPVCVKVDMKRLGLVKDYAHNRDKWRSLTTRKASSTVSVR